MEDSTREILSESNFADMLVNLRHGATLAELDAELVDLLHDVQLHRKRGGLTFTIDVKPASKGDSVTVTLEDKIKVTKPKPDRSASIFFIEGERLVRNDPRQTKLELREPEAPLAEVRHLKEVK